MSDYTPTTDAIETAWSDRADFLAYVAHEPRSGGDEARYRAQFRGWLAQHDAEVRKAALNAAADDVPPSTPPLGGELAISEPVRMRFQQWLRARAGGAS